MLGIQWRKGRKARRSGLRPGIEVLDTRELLDGATSYVLNGMKWPHPYTSKLLATNGVSEQWGVQVQTILGQRYLSHAFAGKLLAESQQTGVNFQTTAQTGSGPRYLSHAFAGKLIAESQQTGVNFRTILGHRNQNYRYVFHLISIKP